MKRALIVFLILLLITGCGKKDTVNTVSCHSNTNDGIKSSRLYMIGSFVNDELSTIEISGKISGEGIEEDRDFYDWYYGDMALITGITFESSLKDDYTFKVLVDLPLVPDDSNYNKSELPKNEVDFILYAGKQGYVCE